MVLPVPDQGIRAPPRSRRPAARADRRRDRGIGRRVVTEPGEDYRLYSELAGWWPLISPVGEYAGDAAAIEREFGSSGMQVRTLLDLGSGGGHVALHLRPGRAVTLV